MILVIFSGAKLNKRFITERLAVDKTYVSLRATRNVSNGEAIFAEGLLDETVPLWKQIWTAYFLYPETREHNYLASASGARFWNSALDGKLVVISKSDPWIKGPAVLLSQILWENEGFKLGRLCSSDECLSSSTTDLSSLKIGESLYEDSLLKSGWSLREADGRWTSAQKASLRLVTKENDFFTSVIIEAMTLAVPQKLSVVIDDMPIGSIMLKKDWDTYELLVPYLSADVHDVVFNFSHSYSPAGLGISSDSRILPARFKFIGFK